MSDDPKPTHKDVGKDTEHVSRAKDPAIVRRSQKPIQVIQNLLRGIGLAILALLLISWLKGCGDDDTTSSSNNVAPAPAPVVVERTVVRNNGMMKRSFRFNARTGCVGVPIHGSFEHYLFGGDTLIIERPHPSGRVDTVPPGADWRPRGNQPVGEYTFCVFDPTPSDSIVVWAENWRN